MLGLHAFYLLSLKKACCLMLQITAVTRFKGVATSEDFKSRDSISRKPSKAQQPTAVAKQTLTGELPAVNLIVAATACCSGKLNMHISFCMLSGLVKPACSALPAITSTSSQTP